MYTERIQQKIQAISGSIRTSVIRTSIQKLRYFISNKSVHIAVAFKYHVVSGVTIRVCAGLQGPIHAIRR